MCSIWAFASVLLLASSALAQTRPPRPVVSPEVHPDRKVTFRLRAPKATEVTFTGDWMAQGVSEKMTKDADGVWSVTLGPLEPSIYIYTFLLDGVTIADPVNPRIKLRSQTSASMVEVSGTTPAIWQPRDVPHGAVEINWHKSSVVGDEARWVWIYTPPGYDKERSKKYPVLYLFHGNNDIAGGWTLAGQANFILDNLIAEKKAVPMIVVMPYGHAVPYGTPGGKNNQVFDEYITKEVIPLVEGKYRVASGSQNRAVAGLSMGGGHSLLIGFSHPEMFSAVGAFSAAVPSDFDTRFKTVLADSKGTNKQLKTIWFACGRQDSLFDRSQKLADTLKASGVTHTFRPTEGGHTYTVWRQYLSEFAPLLFH